MKPVAKSHRVKVLIIVMVLLSALLTWDFLALRNHRASLARLQQAMERAQTVQSPLRRDNVAALLAGSPTRQSAPGSGRNLDYFTWRGLIHNFHICVEFNAAGEVVSVENSHLPERTSISDDIAPTLHSTTSTADVDAALVRAEQLFRQSGDKTKEFQETLGAVYDGLPEIKLSTVKGSLVWNSFESSRSERRLFAMRFETPPGQRDKPLELDTVRWVNRAEYAGIISIGVDSPTWDSLEVLRARRRWDVEPDVKIEGVQLPDDNFVGFGSRLLNPQPLHGGLPLSRFILWFFTGDHDPQVPFEMKTAMFASEAGASPLRVGAHEVCEFIGMRTSIPVYSPTPDGVRSALTAFNERLARDVIGPGSCVRILRPVKAALPEIAVSTTPGVSRWQKLEFPHGPCSAVRVRIPASMEKGVSFYGAILCPRPAQFGWDQPTLGEFTSRTLFDASWPEIELPAPNRLTVFSFSDDLLQPGQEIVLWFREIDAQQPAGPVFVTLSALPPDEKNKPGYPTVNAGMPWSCGKLLGVAVPPPAAPDDCIVLGMHELPMSRLLFTPDSHRLLSVDGFGFVRNWNVESRQLQGQLTLPYGTADFAVAGLDNETIWAVDNPRASVLQWSLDSCEPVQAPTVPLRVNEHLRVLGFGSNPTRLVVVNSFYAGRGDGSFEERPRFNVFDFAADRWTEPPESTPGIIGSLVYLPALNLFASDMTRFSVDSEKKWHVVSSVLIWPADFSKPIQELELANFPVNYQGEEANPIQLSASPDGRRLAAICKRGHLKVWNVVNWDEALTTPLPNVLLSVSLSADGETVATTETDNNAVSLWRISSGQRSSAWQTDDTPITHVTHSPDGKWVATANMDGVIRLWKNTLQDAAIRQHVSQVPQPEQNIRTPKPAPPPTARAVQPEQFLGKWSGKWDGQWKVQITISKKPNTDELQLLYEWEENAGQPMQSGAVRAAKIENNTLVSGNLEITLVANNPESARVIGKFQRPRTAMLRRESP